MQLAVASAALQRGVCGLQKPALPGPPVAIAPACRRSFLQLQQASIGWLQGMLCARLGPACLDPSDKRTRSQAQHWCHGKLGSCIPFSESACVQEPGVPGP